MIEHNMHHIWVGPLERPKKWMDTWPEKHPGWNYKLWDNEAVFGRKWRNQAQIDHYRDKGIWHGVADLVRYEILHEFGGFMPGADSECLLPIDELFENEYELFAVRCGAEPENWQREDGGKDETLPPFLTREDKRLVAPIYAAKAGNEFLEKLIDGLHDLDTKSLREPWRTTGNVYCSEMIKKHEPKIKIWPMHFFIPYHAVTIDARKPYIYVGKDKVYARHFWGTTNRSYHKGI